MFLPWIDFYGRCDGVMTIKLSHQTLVLALIDQYTVKSLFIAKQCRVGQFTRESTLTTLVFPCSSPEFFVMIDMMGSWQLNCHITHLCWHWLTSIRSNSSLYWDAKNRLKWRITCLTPKAILPGIDLHKPTPRNWWKPEGEDIEGAMGNFVPLLQVVFAC